MTDAPAYGLWSLVVLNSLVSLVFIILASSFTRPRSRRRSPSGSDVRLGGQSELRSLPPAFILIMFGFLLRWPTLITIAMFQVRLVVSARLAKSEERDSLAEFGAAYEEYRKQVPAFVPKLGKHELQSGYQ